VDVPAYEIGGVFLLVVLFMYGTSVSGFFPKLRGHGKTVAIVIAVVAIAALAIRYSPEWMEQARAAFIDKAGKPEPERAPASPAKSAAKARAHSAKAVVKPSVPEPAPEAKMIVVPEDLPETKVPAQADSPTNTDAYDSRMKHAAKSVGRFLHVIPKRNP
jgi:hypothetical protein